MAGKVYLSAEGSGKVQNGNQVCIKFDRFPFQEYGIVAGEVAAISTATHENRYVLDVSLPQGLQTSYRK